MDDERRRLRLSILSLSAIARDARVRRQIDALSPYFDISVIGFCTAVDRFGSGVRVFPVRVEENVQQGAPVGGRLSRLGSALRTGFVERAYRLRGMAVSLAAHFVPALHDYRYWRQPERGEALRQLLLSAPDLILANDWDSLPIAARAAESGGAAVVADFHEYSPLQDAGTLFWAVACRPMIEHHIRRTVPHLTGAITVCTPIAERYRTEFGIEPIVILNAPTRSADLPAARTDPAHVRLVHHGFAMRNRRLELMIEMAAHLQPRFSLHFHLVARDPSYLDALEEKARRLAPGRVFFHPPVSPGELSAVLSAYDMGVYLLKPANFNQEVCLPNKLFDFLGAGLAVAVGPAQEMARLVRQYGIGIVADSYDPGDLATAINRLSSDDVDRMKARSVDARRQVNGEVEMERLVEFILSKSSLLPAGAGPCE